jgi:hypothetical protein
MVPTSTSLVVVTAKDFPHLNIPIAKAVRYRLESMYPRISVGGVLQFFKEWGMLNAEIEVQGVWTGRTLGRVWELQGTNAVVQQARTLPCRFMGGPPGKVKSYTGTLYTLLLDRATSLAVQHGFGAIQKIFPNGLS